MGDRDDIGLCEDNYGSTKASLVVRLIYLDICRNICICCGPVSPYRTLSINGCLDLAVTNNSGDKWIEEPSHYSAAPRTSELLCCENKECCPPNSFVFQRRPRKDIIVPSCREDTTPTCASWKQKWRTVNNKPLIRLSINSLFLKYGLVNLKFR